MKCREVKGKGNFFKSNQALTVHNNNDDTQQQQEQQQQQCSFSECLGMRRKDF